MKSVRTIRLKVRDNAYSWLSAAAIEVNQVWNWANETSSKAARPFYGKSKWLGHFDLNNLASGGTQNFTHIGSGTIQRVNGEYVSSRRKAKKYQLRWRVSRGCRRSLGWVPFQSACVKRKGTAIRFCGKRIRLFGIEALDGLKFRDGCFSQDSIGDWWLCIPVEYQAEPAAAESNAVGIDLGIEAIATTSDGDTLESGRWTQRTAEKLAQAQRRGHKRQAKRIHRKIARQRQDALHKFSRRIVNQYQHIVVGDVSSTKLVKTKMAKSVLDSGWGILKTQLQYKGEHAGRVVQVVSEKYTTRVCSSCGCISGPGGLRQLVVRHWVCSECGAEHDRDVNAARNILTAGLGYRASVCGNESLPREVAA